MVDTRLSTERDNNMAPPRYLPSDSILAGWVEAGMTHQQIADRIAEDTGVQVSRSSVSAALSKAGLTKRIRYKDLVPWRVRSIHNRAHPLNMLRLEGRRRGGETLSDSDLRNLESFKRRLKEADAVVAYLPDTEEGWWIVKARPGIDKGMIREP
jgi:hypothetical protein